MPDVGAYHPIVVHFAIALLMVGVLFRWIALAGRVAFADAAATPLVVLATVAALVAAWSGEEASVAAEGVPGAAAAVHAHETWGARTRDVAIVLAIVEVVAAASGGRRVRAASALVGTVAVACVAQTGRLGGELVYGHAAGVGVRSGDPADVARLLVAGLSAQADVDDRAGRRDDAAALLELAAKRFPDDGAVQLRAAQALLEDRKDPADALALLQRPAAAEEPRQRLRRGWLTADALEALGRGEEARTVVERLRTEFPDDARVRRRLARVVSDATAPPVTAPYAPP